MNRAIIAILGISLTSAIVLYGNFKGMCYSQLRPLSNDELIRIAAEHVVHALQPGGRAFKMQGENLVEIQSVEPDFHYKDADDFLRRNPGCCSVVPAMIEYGHTPSLATRLRGRFAGYVRINYIDPTDRNVAERKKIKTSYLALTNCGVIWDGI